MKAVILEVKGNKAIALSDDGLVNAVRNQGYQVGHTIEMEEMTMKKSTKKFSRMFAGIAAAMVILLGGGTAFAYNTPVAHVSVDVNPSMVYSVNMFNKVIDVEMANDDAKLILDTIEWDGEDLTVVVEKTIDALKDNGYLDDAKWYKKGLVIGVNSNSESKETELITSIKNELERIVFEETNEEISLDDNEDVVVGIGKERVDEAARLSEALDMKVTPGKLNLVEKLDASYLEAGDEDVNSMTEDEIGDWLGRPVQDIMEQIKVNKALIKEGKETGKPDYTTPKGIENKLTKGAIDDDEDEDEDDLDTTSGKGIKNANENALKNRENENEED